MRSGPKQTKDASDRLRELARRIEGAAWNRPGSDKTWVLDALWQRGRLEGEIRRPSVSDPSGRPSAPPVGHAAGR